MYQVWEGFVDGLVKGLKTQIRGIADAGHKLPEGTKEDKTTDLAVHAF